MRHRPPTVLIVGPNPEAVGGMASVVGQIVEMDFQGSFQTRLFVTTESTSHREAFVSRLIRHATHMARLAVMIISSRAKIVHIHTCSGQSFFRSAADMLIAKLLVSKVILHIHGAAFDRFHQHSSSRVQHLIGWLLSRADGVIALSRHWEEVLRNMSASARVVVIENAVQLHPTFPTPTADEPCRFLFLGRMDLWKGIDDLLEAAAIVKKSDYPFELILAGPPGSAGDDDLLNKKIRSVGLSDRTRYVGTVLGEEKRARLMWANAYIQPSHHEGLPIALLEALSWGLPVVATRVGAMGEVITDGQEGYIVQPHRPLELAGAMKRMIENPSDRVRMSSAARQLAERRFSLDRFRDDLGHLYENLSTTFERNHVHQAPRAQTI